MRKIILAAFAVSMLCFGFSKTVAASVIGTNVVGLGGLGVAQDGFNATRDLSNGLDWLDWSFTTDRSYNYVTDNLLGSGQILDGWRYANSTDFSNLGISAEIPTSHFDNFGGIPAPQQLVDLAFLLGITSPDVGDDRSIAIFDNLPEESREGVRLGGITLFHGGDSIFDVPLSTGTINFFQDVTKDFSIIQLGSALVRENGVSPVPEPTTLIIYALGLVGMGAMRRRRFKAIWVLTFKIMLGPLFFVIVSSTTNAGPIGFSIISQEQSSQSETRLYRIDLATGVSSDLGNMSFDDAEGMAFLDDQLFAIGGTVDEFWNVTSPSGLFVGNTGSRDGADAGLAYDRTTSKLYNLNAGPSDSTLYEINPLTGAATLVGIGAFSADGFAIDGNGNAFAINAGGQNRLYSVNLITGSMAIVGSLGTGPTNKESGLSFDVDDVLWGISDAGEIFTIDTLTGLLSLHAQATIGGVPFSGFESLAILIAETPIPEPSTIAIFVFGLAGLGVMRRRRTT
jgi:hypothetical protein